MGVLDMHKTYCPQGKLMFPYMLELLRTYMLLDEQTINIFQKSLDTNIFKYNRGGRWGWGGGHFQTNPINLNKMERL